MSRLLLALCLGSALAISGCGGAESSASPTGTAAQTGAETVSREEDRRRAGDAVLTLADLGSGWEPYDLSEDRVVASELECFRFELADLVETAEVSSDTFAAGSPTLLVAGKVFIRSSHLAASSTRIYETEADAEAAFDRVVDLIPSDPVLRCLLRADTVRQGPRMAHIQGFYFPIGKSFPAITEQTWAQQYKMRIAKKGGLVWLDVVIMREERALGVVFFSSLEIPPLSDPVSNEFVKRMAKRVGKRLAP